MQQRPHNILPDAANNAWTCMHVCKQAYTCMCSLTLHPVSSNVNPACSSSPRPACRRNQNLFEDQQQMMEAEVERLSGLVSACSDALEEADGVVEPQARMRNINCTVALQKRIVSLFSLIENDLYGALSTCSATIATFRPRRNLVP